MASYRSGKFRCSSSLHQAVVSQRVTPETVPVLVLPLLDPVWRLERVQQATIFSLRTRHCGLNAHLKRTCIVCECGQTDLTPVHVLQSCPKYAERRQLTWPQGADLATKLWGLAEDLYRTAGFVASTGLKI